MSAKLSTNIPASQPEEEEQQQSMYMKASSPTEKKKHAKRGCGYLKEEIELILDNINTSSPLVQTNDTLCCDVIGVDSSFL